MWNTMPTEVLLERRPEGVSLMPGMYELPELPQQVPEGREPVLRIRHSITNTNYYVQVFASHRHDPDVSGKAGCSAEDILQRDIPEGSRELEWTRLSRLVSLPLTGLARKILQRRGVMDKPHIALLE